MLEVLNEYPNGQPQKLRWRRDDGTEVFSFLKYEESFDRSDEHQSYVVWGTIFHVDIGEVRMFDKRFFSEEYAEAFYKKVIEMYPQSRVKMDKCIPLKKYF